jgi:hypothetical protein
MERQRRAIREPRPGEEDLFLSFPKPEAQSPKPRSSGIVLLEVVLAMGLLVLASGVIVGSMGACTQAASRLKLRAHAADLAVTLASQVQMGVLKAASAEGKFDEPGMSDWTWQMRVTASEQPDWPLEQVEFQVRHAPTGVMHRLVELLPVQPLRSPRQAAPARSSQSPSDGGPT